MTILERGELVGGPRDGARRDDIPTEATRYQASAEGMTWYYRWDGEMRRPHCRHCDQPGDPIRLYRLFASAPIGTVHPSGGAS
jgi:hypothetical protein